MSVKSDRWIRNKCIPNLDSRGMIDPFVEKQTSKGLISYGLSSYGYDCRVSDDFRIFSNSHGGIVDPKNFNKDFLVEIKGQPYVDIPPSCFALARTVEWFKIPRNIITVCVGKSTYARCGIIVNVTPFEPEWEGFATMEISNSTPLPVRVYSNEGIAQILFFESDEVCEVSYADRKGKYQSQTELTLPKVL
jgi:dCTP deaminase